MRALRRWLYTVRGRWVGETSLNPLTVSSNDARAFFVGLNTDAARAISKRLSLMVTAFDIGANSGSFTFELCKSGKQLEVLLFEPIANLVGVSREVLSEFSESKFHFLNTAVGDYDGELTLFLPDDGNIGWITAVKDQTTSKKYVTVPVRDIGPYFKDWRPDFVKIDVEGTEGPILKRLVENLCEFWSPLIYVELAWGRKSANWPATVSTLAEFADHGYEFSTLDAQSNDFDHTLTIDDLWACEHTIDLLMTPKPLSRWPSGDILKVPLSRWDLSLSLWSSGQP